MTNLCKLKYLLLLGLLSHGSLASAGEPLLIELSEKASFAKSSITLGEFARIRGGSPELVRRIASLEIADRPVDYRPVSISAREIEYRIRLEGVQLQDFRITGSSGTVISTAKRTITQEEVIQEAKSEILKRLMLSEKDVSVALSQTFVQKLPEVPASENVSFKCEPLGGLVRIGRCQINVTVLVAGQRIMAFPLYFEVMRSQSVLVTTRAVFQGEKLDDTNTKVESHGIAENLAVSRPEQLTGKITTKPLSAGQIVGAGDVDVREPLMVHVNQKVTMIARVGNLEIIADGVALQDGRMGNTIRVMNSDSKIMVTGKVTAAGVVTIHTGG